MVLRGPSTAHLWPPEYGGDRERMYVVIVDGEVVAECISTGTAGGILKHHGRGMIAEVLYEAQENKSQTMGSEKPAMQRNYNKNRVAKMSGGVDR